MRKHLHAVSPAWHSALRVARREELALLRLETGFTLLANPDYEVASAAAQTFYILGSGASVNDLTESQWSEISEGYSVGLNSWAFHPFLPSSYALESPREARLAEQRSAIEKGLSRASVIEKKPPILYFRNNSFVHVGGSVQIPSELHNSVRLYGRTQFPPVSSSHLVLLLEAFLRRDVGFARRNCLLLDNGSTVIRLIHFALRAGFRKVVLLGVDLGERQYFFEENPEIPEQAGVEAPSMGAVPAEHPTLLPGSRTAGFLSFLSKLSVAAADIYGARVETGSDARVWQHWLPRHPW